MNGKQLKNSILQWAIQGKLVPQDPNDEPASVLLERIREEKARLVKEKKIKKDKNESIIFRGDDNSHYEKFADGTIKCIDDEIPFEVPRSWCWVRLIGVGKTETGTTPSKTHPEYFGDYMPFIGPGNIQGNKIVSYTQGISEIGVDYCRPVPKNTILQVCIGGSIGKAAITTEWSAFNQQINSIEPYQCVDYKYVFYTLLTDYFKKAMIERSTGTATPIINRSNWEGIILPIPPQPEQQRIVARIEELMPIADKYEKSQEALDKLNAEIFEKLKKSVLQEAIQGKLVPQSPDDEPASVLLERINVEKAKLFKDGKLKKKDLVDSVIFKGEDNKYYETVDGKTECIDDRIPFELPHKWCWATLGNLVQNCSGLAYKKENLDERSTSYIRVLRGGNIDDGQWTIKDDDVMIASKFVKPELLLTAGTFITPAVTSIEQMGKTALVRDDQPQTVVGGFVLMLSPFLKDWSLLNYLDLIFQSEYYKGYCRSITNKSGQAFYNLSRQKLMQFLVPLPPLNERIRIAEEVAKVNSLMR